jgi:hypothetical protein
MDGTENTMSNISIIVTYMFVAVEKCSTICCPAMLGAIAKTPANRSAHQIQ